LEVIHISKRSTPPPITVEQEERECISLAVELAKKQLREGTATSQVITHYLDMASPLTKEKARRVELENKLIEAKISKLKAEEDYQRIAADALAAFKEYSGQDDYDEEEIY
jgi:hypothetical protein